jgi:hypothetical protein
MRRIPFRLFLPIFHFLMDLILVIVLIFDEQAELRHEKRPSTIRTNDIVVMPVAFPQELGTVEFDPRFIDYPPSPPLLLLATCVPPATLVLSWAMPKADLQRIVWRSTEWWWLAVYEAIGVLLWLLMGSIADSNQPGVYRWCFALIIIRILALAVAASPIWKLGPILQSVFWLGATISVIAEGLWRMTQRLRSRPRRAT